LPSRRERAPRHSPEPIQPPSDDYISERDHQTAEDATGVPSASWRWSFAARAIHRAVFYQSWSGTRL